MDVGHACRFTPHRLLRSGHLQTLTCAIDAFRSGALSEMQARSEDLWIAVDGGQILARALWADGERPAIVLVHGVGGADNSAYVVRAAAGFLAAGYHVIRMNLRGAGDSVTRAPGLYHMGLTSDLAELLSHVAARPNVRSCAVLGFSGGGNVALKLAAAWGASMPPQLRLRAMVSLSAPLDLAWTAQHMNRIRNLPYHAHVLRGLHRGARGLLRYRSERAQYLHSDLLRITSIRKFDTRITVPMYGFPSVDAYYASGSAGPDLRHIALPTLVLHAEDDPMVPAESIRKVLRNASSTIEPRFTKYGGHLGWISNLEQSQWTQTWAIREAIGFLSRHACD
jgi:uncharacterized protein